jgi:hypothetical protein
MDQKQRLTRPATPRAIRMVDGRYSFVSQTNEDSVEKIEIPNHLREDRITAIR